MNMGKFRDTEIDWSDLMDALEAGTTVCNTCGEEGRTEDMEEHEVDHHHGTRIFHTCQTCGEE